MSGLRIVLVGGVLFAVILGALVYTSVLGTGGEGIRSQARTVGGDFTLTSHTGQRFSSDALKGRPYLVFFGFTQCPDVCPTTLLEVTNHLKSIDDAGGQIGAAFISVDPERDTPEVLQAYLSSFDSRIVGLTGPLADVTAVARKFKAFFAKVPTDSGYTIDHTSTVYMMDGRGRLAGSFTFEEPVETQRQKLLQLVSR